jgi:hypothetical protein
MVHTPSIVAPTHSITPPTISSPALPFNIFHPHLLTAIRDDTLIPASQHKIRLCLRETPPLASLFATAPVPVRWGEAGTGWVGMLLSPGNASSGSVGVMVGF